MFLCLHPIHTTPIKASNVAFCKIDLIGVSRFEKSLGRYILGMLSLSSLVFSINCISVISKEVLFSQGLFFFFVNIQCKTLPCPKLRLRTVTILRTGRPVKMIETFSNGFSVCGS